MRKASALVWVLGLILSCMIGTAFGAGFTGEPGFAESAIPPGAIAVGTVYANQAANMTVYLNHPDWVAYCYTKSEAGVGILFYNQYDGARNGAISIAAVDAEPDADKQMEEQWKQIKESYMDPNSSFGEPEFGQTQTDVIGGYECAVHPYSLANDMFITANSVFFWHAEGKIYSMTVSSANALEDEVNTVLEGIRDSFAILSLK